MTASFSTLQLQWLPFRLLCRRWGCDLAFTPMIVAEDFINSKEAREIEFTTNKDDRPLITQFAARDPFTLGKAAEFVARYCDGIDINCGCPQRWALTEGYGCALLDKPELLQEMIKEAKVASDLPISIKIRISPDLRNTVELVQRAEKMGVSWITVHGRTADQRSNVPVNYDAVKIIKESAAVPIFGNGNCFSLSDVQTWKDKTGVNGVMAGRGVLQNPALFGGYQETPKAVVRDWLTIALALGLPTHKIHQHLMFMLYTVHGQSEKQEFNNLKSIPAILQFFESRGYMNL